MLKTILFELSPELKQVCSTIGEFGKQLKTVVKQIADTPEFKLFMEGLQLYIVKSKLRADYWAIDDIVLIASIKEKEAEKAEDIIIKYYTNDNCFEIKNLVSKWETYQCIEDRMPIFKSCLNLMNGDNLEDTANATIPTLMSQLTGLKECLLETIPIEEKNGIIDDLKNNKKPGETPGHNDLCAEYLWRNEMGESALDCYSVIFEKALINKGNFDKLSPEEISKYDKFRNKILHGDKRFLNYGTVENLIRSWLELNLLIKIYNELNKKEDYIK